MPQNRYGNRSSLILSQAGNLHQRAQQYFGIDLHRLPHMSDREMGAIADRANAMQRLLEALPILEKHFETLIRGQVEYEQFVQRTLKEVDKGSKKIDKTMLDAWLLSKGYDKHLGLMKQKAGLGLQKLEAEFRSEFSLNNLDFYTAVRLIHMRHHNRKREIQQKVPRAQVQMRMQEQQRLDADKRRDLLTYGTQGRTGRSLLQRVATFFSV